MALKDELDLAEPIANVDHEAAMSIVLTAGMLAKEADRVLRPLGLTGAQFNVLMNLAYQSGREGVNQTQLGRMLLVNRSNVTGLVDRMEAAGWIRRVDQVDDRRVKSLELTPAGRKLLARTEPVYMARMHEVMRGLSGMEDRQLARMLERIRARLRKS